MIAEIDSIAIILELGQRDEEVLFVFLGSKYHSFLSWIRQLLFCKCILSVCLSKTAGTF